MAPAARKYLTNNEYAELDWKHRTALLQPLVMVTARHSESSLEDVVKCTGGPIGILKKGDLLQMWLKMWSTVVAAEGEDGVALPEKEDAVRE